MGDQRLGGQPARHDALGRVGLHDHVPAAPAGVARAPGHQHAELRRHDVEALGDVLPDQRHRPAAARAQHAAGLDHALDAGQVRRKPAAEALDGAAPRARRFQRRVGSLLGGVEHALRQLDVLQRQGVLLEVALLRLGPEPRAAQLVHDELEPQAAPPRRAPAPPCARPAPPRTPRARPASRRGAPSGRRHRRGPRPSWAHQSTPRCRRSRSHTRPESLGRGSARQARPRRALGPNPSPVQALEQRGELRRAQAHHAVRDLGPGEGATLEPLRDQNQAGPVPHEDLDPVGPLQAEDKDRAAERVEAERLPRTTALRPSCPLRKSTGRVAT